ncbi:MAG: hypothetical protein ABIR18_12145 [Chitinophagaceae bacterium]
MKQAVFIVGTSFIIAGILASCRNDDQSKAIEQAKQVQSVIKENAPGSVPATAGGYTMTAKLDGKDWTAVSVMPPEAAGRIIGYNHGEYIGLPYNSRDLVVGGKTVFGEDNAVDLATNDDIGMWGGRKGEMEITKVDGNWAEGRFFFTASSNSTNKTLEVTDGFFRIPL